MNQVQLFGRLTRDPEMRYTPQGKAVVNFSLAVSRYGENEADFFECTAWEKQAENINNSCKKGHRLLIWGRLHQDRWTDQQTQQNRSAVKIVVSGFSFIEPPPQQGQPGAQPPAGPPAYGPPGYGYPPQGYPGYVPPAAGVYPPSSQPPAQQQGQYLGRLGGPPPGGQHPPAQHTQSPAGPPSGPPPGYQYPGHQPPAGGYSGNIDDIPF